MDDNPTSLRVRDPGIRELFTIESNWQSWLDVEAALAVAEAELGVIPEAAAKEIVAKARLELLDRERIIEGLRRTGHPIVPVVWELSRICEGDAGGYVHWGATTQNIIQTGDMLLLRRVQKIFFGQLAAILAAMGDLAERTKRHGAARPHAWPARGAGHLRAQGRGLDRRDEPARGAAAGRRAAPLRRHAGRRRGHHGVLWRQGAGDPGAHGRASRHDADGGAVAHDRRPPGGIRRAARPDGGDLQQDRA